MKTLNRPTASIPTKIDDELSTMSSTIRQLWFETLPAETPGRQDLLVDLTLLELDVERLHVRSAVQELTAEDEREFARCLERLAVLEGAWTASRSQSGKGSL